MKMDQFPDKASRTSDYDSLKKSYEIEIRNLAQARLRIIEMENTIQTLNDWEQERIKLVQSIMRRDVELTKIRHALQDSTKACDSLTEQVKIRLDEIVYLTKRTIKAEDRVKELITSTSWKVTAPARKIMKTLRRLVGR